MGKFQPFTNEHDNLWHEYIELRDIILAFSEQNKSGHLVHDRICRKLWKRYNALIIELNDKNIHDGPV